MHDARRRALQRILTENPDRDIEILDTDANAALRQIFGEHVLNHPMLKSTAISDAGLTNQTLFEIERSQLTKSTYDRALDSVNNVNGEIEALIKSAWGRAT